jgi:membrane protease YdiL (CAAX protease family)
VRWAETDSRRIRHSLVLVFLRAALLFVVGMGIIGGTLLGDELFSSGWKSFVLLAGLLGVFDVGIVLYGGLLRFGGVTLRELGWRFDSLKRDVPLGLLGFAAATAVLFGAMIGTGETTLGEIFERTASFGLSERLVYLLIAVFGAALVEESLFRGYLQPALASKLGLAGAIVVQAIIFSAMHMRFHPLGFLVKVAFGVIFGVLRGRDRSLVAPGIAHGLIWAVWGS